MIKIIKKNFTNYLKKKKITINFKNYFFFKIKKLLNSLIIVPIKIKTILIINMQLILKKATIN